MRWSKLKQRIEDNFAESIRSRVKIHSTAYDDSSFGRAWLTLDGDLVASFCTDSYFNRHKHGCPDNDRELTDSERRRYKNQFVEYGEFGRDEVYAACWSFVHELSIGEALASDDPLIQSLAALDKRLGKRRFEKLVAGNLHPLARKLLETRASAELGQLPNRA